MSGTKAHTSQSMSDEQFFIFCGGETETDRMYLAARQKWEASMGREINYNEVSELYKGTTFEAKNIKKQEAEKIKEIEKEKRRSQKRLILNKQLKINI